MGLLTCPFCRELFATGEATECPVCGVRLLPLESLPPSAETRAGMPLAPELETLPWRDFSRAKGLLLLLGAAGLGLFLLPWIHVTLPDDVTISGWGLGRRLGWPWGAGVAWFVLLPTVLSRRSIATLRGARVAAAFLAAVPAITVAIFLAKPPRGGIVPLVFEYAPALWGTLAVSVVAIVVGVGFLGGRRVSSHPEATMRPPDETLH